eukprot:2451061-Rhodomonas_salina.2
MRVWPLELERAGLGKSKGPAHTARVYHDGDSFSVDWWDGIELYRFDRWLWLRSRPWAGQLWLCSTAKTSACPAPATATSIAIKNTTALTLETQRHSSAILSALGVALSGGS